MSELNITVDAAMDTSAPLGIILYVDGGSRAGREKGVMVGGYGIHGYVYRVPDIELPIIPNTLNYTDGGYYDLTPIKVESDEDEEFEGIDGEDVVTTRATTLKRVGKIPGKVVAFVTPIDVTETLLGDGYVTNNVAELTAMLTALTQLSQPWYSKVVIQTDSEYVLKGLTEYAPKWRNNGWCNSKGEEISNKELFIKTIDAYDKLKKETKVKLVKVKAHNGDYGNELADKYATQAVLAGINGKPINNLNYARIYQNGKIPKLPKIVKHPFIQLKEVLFFKNQRANENDFRYYFMSLPSVTAGIKKELAEGVTKEEAEAKRKKRDFFEYIGKSDTETIYQICSLKKPIVVIENLIKHVKEYDKTLYDKVFLGRINQIFNNDNYHDLLSYGGHVFETDGDYGHRIVIRSNTPKKILASEVSPPRRLHDTTFILEQMSDILNGYLSGCLGIEYVITDVTDICFDKSGKKVVIHPDFNSKISSLRLSVNYRNGDDIDNTTYNFMLAYDLPPRGLFLHSAVLNPTVAVITWPEVGFGIRYAIVINSDDGATIWCNWYSNIVIIQGD